MDLNAAQRLALDLMAEHGLTALGWTFAFDRAKTRVGMCNHTHKRITLSAVNVPLNTDADILDTILHEIAHAHVGHAAGHGPVWQRMARRIGANGQRITETKQGAKGRYEIRCASGGGHVLGHFHRRPKRSYNCKAHGVPVTIYDTVERATLGTPVQVTAVLTQPSKSQPAWVAGSSSWDEMWGD